MKKNPLLFSALMLDLASYNALASGGAYTQLAAASPAAIAGQLTQVNFVDGGMNGQGHCYY
jgi:hypothetical protein